MGIATIPAVGAATEVAGFVLSVPIDTPGAVGGIGALTTNSVNIPAGGYEFINSAETVSLVAGGVTTLASAPSIIFEAPVTSATINFTPKYLVETTAAKTGSTVREVRYYDSKAWLPNSAGPNGLSYSTDGITWTTPSINNVGGMSTFVYDANRTDKYVLAGSSGELWSSTDSVTWNSRSTGVGGNFTDSMTDGSAYFVCGTSGALITSTDGISWTNVTHGLSTNTISLCYYNASLTDKYIIGTTAGACQTSTDGVTWTTRSSSVGFGTSQFYMAAYANGKVWVTGSGGCFANSTDGVTWTNQNGTLGTANLSCIATDGTNILVSGSTGLLQASTDGVTWTSMTNSAGSTSTFSGLVYAPAFSRPWANYHQTYDVHSVSIFGQAVAEAGVLLTGPYAQTTVLT